MVLAALANYTASALPTSYPQPLASLIKRNPRKLLLATPSDSLFALAWLNSLSTMVKVSFLHFFDFFINLATRV